MLFIIFILLLCLVLVILAALLYFGCVDHSQFDLPRPAMAQTATEESEEHRDLVELVRADQRKSPKRGRKQMLAHLREQMDARGLAHQIDAQVIAVYNNSVRGEWVLSENCEQHRRMLYVHGGAYMVGSPRSHRLIAARMSKATKAAVFVVEYRLLPENKRISGILDCQRAYQWVLDNGPDGSSNTDALIIAGDSSGGNIALSLLAWARDTHKTKAKAAVVFSPQTDLTLSSPSLVGNAATDVMQGDSFGPIVRAPKPIGLAFSYLMHRINPQKPIVSPLLGNLAGLPPTLIQVSKTEMFLDDAVRYSNKANAQGSPVSLQVWPCALHVWQAFPIPEADDAFRSC